MSLKDRGTIKWTSLMLPEHVKMVKQVFEEEKREKKPIIDEQQMWENENLLNAALKGDLEVEVEYFANHERQTIAGYVVYIDVLRGMVNIGDIPIKFDDVISVKLL